MFIQIIQGRCSREDEAKALFDRWRSELAPAAKGWLGGTFGFTDDGRLCSVVRFESKQAADANSARPEQGAWWAEMEKLYDGPVTFHDSDDVTLLMDGGSDQAGFVQIIQGRAKDQKQMRGQAKETETELRQIRSDLIGATVAWHGDGGFTQAAYFTSEQEARQNEQAMARSPFYGRFMSMIDGDPAFYDLRSPVFE